MAPLFEGLTCKPELGPDGDCTLGGYPVYVVNAKNVYQIQLAVNLARNLNIRLVIKNTGHDFAGKSTGGGALSIRTHQLKDIKYYSTYNDGDYKGAAFKLGSGVQASELYAAANAKGVDVVGGEGKVRRVGFVLPQKKSTILTCDPFRLLALPVDISSEAAIHLSPASTEWLLTRFSLWSSSQLMDDLLPRTDAPTLISSGAFAVAVAVRLTLNLLSTRILANLLVSTQAPLVSSLLSLSRLIPSCKSTPLLASAS
jgi:hypothetical protein